MWAHWLLRLVEKQARNQAFSPHEAPAHAFHRTGRGVGLVLRGYRFPGRVKRTLTHSDARLTSKQPPRSHRVIARNRPRSGSVPRSRKGFSPSGIRQGSEMHSKIKGVQRGGHTVPKVLHISTGRARRRPYASMSNRRGSLLRQATTRFADDSSRTLLNLDCHGIVVTTAVIRFAWGTSRRCSESEGLNRIHLVRPVCP